MDGDSNGDSSGSDYSYLAHDTSGDILLVADNPSNNGSIFLKSNGGSYQAVACHENGKVELRYQNTKKFETTSDGVTISGTLTVDGEPFIRNKNAITATVTLTTAHNHMSAGPITINSGVTVTVNSGATWTVV